MQTGCSERRRLDRL